MSNEKITTEKSDFFEMKAANVPKARTGYSKEALSRFKRINYMSGLNGHHEYASSNTLKNSVKMALDMDSTFDRFKVAPKGGHFATT